MPRAAAAPEPEPEPMDIHEMAAEQERAAKLERRHNMMSSQKKKKKNTKRQSLSELQIFMLCRTPWRTSDSRLQTYREMYARIGLRPRTCCGPF
jgi:hypothetical protein